MRDLTSPLAESLFDGGDRKHRRNVRRARRNAPKTSSKYGEARGLKTKDNTKGKVYCKPGKQLDKSCAGADPRGFKESGRD